MKYAFAVLLLLAIPSFAADPAEPVTCATNWGYGPSDGPDRWGQISPEYVECDAGQFQAPVVLQNGSQATNAFAVIYNALSAVTVQRTAHGINVYSLGTTNRLTYGSVSAHLVKFHFHTPPEHPDGPAVIELHLVHMTTSNSGYAIAILIEGGGTTNSAIQALIDNAPTTACTSKKLNQFPLTALLPSTTQQWISYLGSLTTPPCTKGVTFFVMRQHLRIANSQIAPLQALSEGARPPQPVNNRPFVVK